MKKRIITLAITTALTIANMSAYAAKIPREKCRVAISVTHYPQGMRIQEYERQLLQIKQTATVMEYYHQ